LSPTPVLLCRSIRGAPRPQRSRCPPPLCPRRPRRLLSLGLVDAPRRTSVAARAHRHLHPGRRLALPLPPPEPVLRAGVRAVAGVRLPLPAPGPLATESRAALSDRHRAPRLSLPHLRGRDDLPRRRLPALRASAPARLLASGRRVPRNAARRSGGHRRRLLSVRPDGSAVRTGPLVAR